MNPKIFSEITGSTHGMRLRMKPPIKPKSRILEQTAGKSCRRDGDFRRRGDRARRFAPNDQRLMIEDDQSIERLHASVGAVSKGIDEDDRAVG